MPEHVDPAPVAPPAPEPVTITRPQLERRSAEALERLRRGLAAQGRVFAQADAVLVLTHGGHIRQFAAAANPHALGVLLHHQGILSLIDGRPRDARRRQNAPGQGGGPVAMRSGDYVNLGATVLNLGGLPAVQSIVQAPAAIEVGGALTWAAPGYHPASRTLVLAGAPLPPAQPWAGALDVVARRRAPHLFDLFSCAPFLTCRDHCNLLVWTVLLFARPALDHFPFLILNSNRKSTGKTTVMRAVAHLLRGDDAPAPVNFAASEDKMDFAIADFAGRPGPTLICVDNVRAKRGQAHLIRSQKISSAQGMHVIGASPKCQSTQPVFDPVFVFTMNSARLEHDLADKFLTVSLHTPNNAPHYFTPVHPLDWARAHRSEIIAEIRPLLEGRRLDTPLGDKLGSRFGRWESLAHAVAADLGLEVDFGAATTSLSNIALVEFNELYEHLKDAGPVTVRALVDATLTRPELLELNAALSQSGALSDARRAAALIDWLHAYILGSDFVLDGRPTKFTLDARTPGGILTKHVGII